MKTSLLGASFISMLSLGCTRVQSFSLERADYAGNGEFHVIVGRHVNVHYQAAPHERTEEVERQYELYRAKFDKGAGRYSARFVSKFGELNEHSQPITYLAPDRIGPSPFKGDRLSCAHNSIYQNWSSVRWQGGLATLCDGVLQVERDSRDACRIDLRQEFFREPALFAETGAQRYPLRIQASGGRLFAYVAFDSTNSEKEFYQATLGQLHKPIGALQLINDDCSVGELVATGIPEGSFIRSLGVESPKVMLLERAGSPAGFHIYQGGSVEALAGSANQGLQFTPQPELDSIFVDDFNHNIIEVKPDMEGVAIDILLPLAGKLQGP